MEVKEALLKRRSIRKFTNENVNDHDITCLLEAAMSGPSAHNKQPWEFYVVSNPLKLKELKEACLYANYNAPLAIVVGGNKNTDNIMTYEAFWVQDCSAAIENILLRATDLSLGAVWCGVYPMMENVIKVKKVLSMGENSTPLGVILIGHPLGISEARTQFVPAKIHYIK